MENSFEENDSQRKPPGAPDRTPVENPDQKEEEPMGDPRPAKEESTRLSFICLR